MSRRKWRIACLSLAVLAAAGCATNAAPSNQARTNLPGKEACIFTANLSDWVVLDDSTLIVYAPMRKDAYLVKLFAPVTDLDFRESLGFEDTAHNGQLCRGDDVIARGSVPQRMSISAVRALSPQQAKELRAAAGKSGAAKH
ncbi:MAG TPA: DUF6491 family protein [Steroidobacteraceae bacterium]